MKDVDGPWMVCFYGQFKAKYHVIFSCTNRKQTKVHKRVLVTGIPYFRFIFNSSFNVGKFDQVKIKKLLESVIDPILINVYTGEFNVDCSNVRSVLVWSNFNLMSNDVLLI